MSVTRLAWLVVSVLVLFLSGPVTVARAQPEPVPPGDQSRFENARVASGLSVVVERAEPRLFAGEDTTYTILARTAGEKPQSVTIRVSLPPGISQVRPGEGGELTEDRYVRYPVTLQPGEPVALHLTGTYPAAGSSEEPARVALTACVVGRGDEPVICATDLAEVERDRGTGRWWLLAGAVAVLAAGAAGAGFVWRRRRLAS